MMVYLCNYHFRNANGSTYTPADPSRYPDYEDEINEAIRQYENDPAWTRVEGKSKI